MIRTSFAILFGALAIACSFGVWTYPLVWIRENWRKIRRNKNRINEINKNR